MTYDAIVVGLGGMGSATLANLATRGLRVLGLEQFGRLHDLGSSSGKSRIIRQAYYEDPRYVPLLLRAYELWREAEAASAISIMHLPGILMAGHGKSALLAGARKSAALHGLALEELDRREAVRRYPAFAPLGDEETIFEREAGFVIPEAAIEAFLRVAAARGAEMRFEARLAGWETIPGGVRVRLEDGSSYEAARLAICAGAWFPALGELLGTPIVVQRNVQHWFAPVPARFKMGTMPAFFLDRLGQPAYLYGFPDFGDGVKAAFHGAGTATTLAELDRTIHDDEREQMRALLAAWLPGCEQTYAGGKVCMYSMTPDEHFVIAPLPGEERIVIAGGFSGHGFKFASVVGELVGDLVAEGGTRHDIAFLSPHRFAGGAVR
jgi:sarcosine oxidase